MTTVYFLVALVVSANGAVVGETGSTHGSLDECFEARELLLKTYNMDSFENRKMYGAQALCVARDVDEV